MLAQCRHTPRDRVRVESKFYKAHKFNRNSIKKARARVYPDQNNVV